MQLGRDEYKIQDEGIWISKKALEELRDHYNKVSSNCIGKTYKYQAWFYQGKADVYIDLLKHFEQQTP